MLTVLHNTYTYTYAQSNIHYKFLIWIITKELRQSSSLYAGVWPHQREENHPLWGRMFPQASQHSTSMYFHNSIHSLPISTSIKFTAQLLAVNIHLSHSFLSLRLSLIFALTPLNKIKVLKKKCYPFIHIFIHYSIFPCTLPSTFV